MIAAVLEIVATHKLTELCMQDIRWNSPTAWDSSGCEKGPGEGDVYADNATANWSAPPYTVRIQLSGPCILGNQLDLTFQKFCILHSEAYSEKLHALLKHM